MFLNLWLEGNIGCCVKHLTFSNFESLKNIGHPTSGSGGKKTIKRYLKSEQTHVHTDKSTYRKHRPKGPML